MKKIKMKNTLVYLHAPLTFSQEISWNAVYFYSSGDPANLRNREARIRQSEGRLCNIIVDRNSFENRGIAAGWSLRYRILAGFGGPFSILSPKLKRPGREAGQLPLSSERTYIWTLP